MPAAAAPAAAALAAPAPAAAAPAAPGSDVVDPTESRRVQGVQRQLHDTRVRLVRAATRLGLTSRNEQVAQFLQVGVETRCWGVYCKQLKRVLGAAATVAWAAGRRV